MSTLVYATAKSIAASICPETGGRIDTLQLRYPRMVHADFMTHRVFSRNASSSRAIPYASLTVRDGDAYVPRFRLNQPGMQPGDFLAPEAQTAAEDVWMEMARACLKGTKLLAAKDGLNVHKQWVNRPLEWFGYIEVLVTSTSWTNFDALRDHSDAQDEIEALAKAIKVARDDATPQTLKHGHWHLPYVTEEDFEAVARMLRGRLRPDGVDEVLALLSRAPRLRESHRNMVLLAISASRACRVSYSRHDGERPTIADDMRRFLQLTQSAPLHASPLEHQARSLHPHEDVAMGGNLIGFSQFRKALPNEAM